MNIKYKLQTKRQIIFYYKREERLLYVHNINEKRSEFYLESSTLILRMKSNAESFDVNQCCCTHFDVKLYFVQNWHDSGMCNMFSYSLRLFLKQIQGA